MIDKILICAMLFLSGCADPLFLDIVTAPVAIFADGEHHETEEDKKLREQNEETVRDYWRHKH